jgi:hypothetical protein
MVAHNGLFQRIYYCRRNIHFLSISLICGLWRCSFFTFTAEYELRALKITAMAILHVNFCKVTKDLVEVLEDPGSNELTEESRGSQGDVVYLG